MAVTVNSSGVPVFYVDGVATGSTLTSNFGTPVLSNYESSLNPILGRAHVNEDSGSYLDGKMDDFAIWSTELSASQISDIAEGKKLSTTSFASDLEAWFTMGDTSIIIQDETANDIDLSVYRATTSSTSVLGNGSIEFGGYGTGNWIEANSNFQTTLRSGWSISMWVKLDYEELNEALFTTYDGAAGQDYYSLQIAHTGIYNSGELLFLAKWASVGGASPLQSRYHTNSYFSTGENPWKHIVLTVSSSAVPTFYVNGNTTTTRTSEQTDLTSISNYNGTQNLILGSFSVGGAAGPIEGFMDDVSLWNTVLTGTQVSALYNSGSGTSLSGSSNLKAWWKMEVNAKFGEADLVMATGMGHQT